MARAELKTKNKAGKPYPCVRCSEKIVAGQKYFKWSFRYGGTHCQHEHHGAPKPSQLTQSKMSGVYAATESAEEAIKTASSPADLAAALNECAASVTEVMEEYQNSFDNIPENLQQGGPAQEMQEKIDALQEFSDSLESAASDLEGEEFEAGDDNSESEEEWLNDLRSQAENSLSELSI